MFKFFSTIDRLHHFHCRSHCRSLSPCHFLIIPFMEGQFPRVRPPPWEHLRNEMCIGCAPSWVMFGQSLTRVSSEPVPRRGALLLSCISKSAANRSWEASAHLSLVPVGCSWNAAYGLGSPWAAGLWCAGARPVEDPRDGVELLRRGRGLFSQGNRSQMRKLIVSFD